MKNRNRIFFERVRKPIYADQWRFTLDLPTLKQQYVLMVTDGFSTWCDTEWLAVCEESCCALRYNKYLLYDEM